MTPSPELVRCQRVLAVVASVSVVLLIVGCVGAPGNPGAPDGGGVPASGGASVVLGTGGVPGSGGAGSPSGIAGSGATTASGGNATRSGGANAARGGATASGGATGTGGGVANTGGARVATGGAAGSSVPPNCTLPTTVGFRMDVQPFLITACGGGNGCHVIDGASTTAAGGFNHAYDWLTAGAHASSCPSNPKRFEVVIAVINGANPPTCSNSRKMPPPNATGADLRAPLTACQVATLQAWLNEPLVTQMHRADDSSPTTPYPMPPFN